MARKAIKKTIEESKVDAKDILEPLVPLEKKGGDILKDVTKKVKAIEVMNTLDEEIKTAKTLTAVRFKATHKGYKAGNDYVLTNRELKGIPKLKYKRI